jgi:hypothetical protein
MTSLNSESDTEAYFSPDELSTPKSNNSSSQSKKRPLETSPNSESPPNSVQTGQGKFVKVHRTGDLQNKSDADMNEATKKFLENLLGKSEGKIVSQINEVKTEVSLLKSDIAAVRIDVLKKVSKLEKQVEALKTDLEKAQSELRKKNVLIEGVPEQENERWRDTELLVDGFFQKLGLSESPLIDDCFRIGNSTPGKIRPILLKLIRFKDKKLIMENRMKLKGTKMYVNDDLTKQQRVQNAVLRKKEKELRRDNPGAKVYSRTSMLILKEGTRTVRYTVKMIQLSRKHSQHFQRQLYKSSNPKKSTCEDPAGLNNLHDSTTSKFSSGT